MPHSDKRLLVLYRVRLAKLLAQLVVKGDFWVLLPMAFRLGSGETISFDFAFMADSKQTATFPRSILIKFAA